MSETDEGKGSVAVWLTRHARRLLKQRAARDGATMSAQARAYVLQGLRRDGLLGADEGAA